MRAAGGVRRVQFIAGLTGLALVAGAALVLRAQAAPAMPAVDANDIGGTVAGPNGPEAGVWVIAETRDLKTRFAKIVVTDEQGRFVIPDLPTAAYSVWVRGYGLTDSAKVAARPGGTLSLRAAPAPTPAEAAKYYPAAYWYAMMHIPTADQFAGSTRDPALPANVRTQAQYLTQMKNNGCVGCHQMGGAATRTIPTAFGTSLEGWNRRLQSGQAGSDMVNQVANGYGGVPLRYLADWTDRVAKGELPADKPARPQGRERDVVITVRDWLDDHHYLHDLISTDRRNPTVNGYGKLYGATELSTNDIPILDPVKNEATLFRAPVRDADTPMSPAAKPLRASAYWGDEAIWDSRANIHNPMFDEQGRVWMTASIRGPNNPAFCKAGSDLPSAKATPVERSGRQLAVLDPRTGKYTFIDTCFSTHHLQFDKNGRLWTSGGGPVVGWLDAKAFDRTGDAARSQGWTALVLDTNGNGRRDAYVEPGQPADPAKDTRIVASFYAVMPSPLDGSVWGSVFAYPGRIVRIAPGASPPETALAEVYDVPLPGYGVRGADIDSKGVVWVSLASGHIGSFDRTRCKGRLNGPAATGAQCPEGWSFYRYPGPSFREVPGESVESSYYSWVDQHDTLGLGKDVPMSTANLFDGIHALAPGGRFMTLRVPYPMGFYAKGFDGRIDDPKAGWKGRGLWASSGDRVPWHMEGGKGTKPLAVHFQLRPDPLAH